MNIFFDARWTRFDTHDGISRYGSELVGALAKLHSVTMIIHDTRQLKLLPKGVPYVVLNHPFSFFKELFIARRLNKLGADVVFSPLQTMGSWGRRYKLILTLQDITYYQHPKPPTHLPLPVRLAWWLFHKAYWPQRLILNLADHVATVSFTSKKFIEMMHLTSKPISVVHNAAPNLGKSSTKNSPHKELVFMGSFMPYKNVELLLHAMPLLPEYKLHLTSRISTEREAELRGLIQNPGQIKFWHGASDQKYTELLSRAAALVTASKSEGFGLPILEAMSCGVPVLCTDMEIFHEVAGDGALFFNPDSPEDFAKCVHELENPKLRQKLIDNGKKQLQIYTWRNSAKQLMKIVEEVMQEK